MCIYATIEGELVCVGTASACSIHDLLGPSFVHVFYGYRDEYDIPREPYDFFFDTCKEALDWANDTFGGILMSY